jgi:hypothetical protein
MEVRMKALCSALLDCMVAPLGDKLDEWRKAGAAMDRDHAKEYKKLRTEIKKKSDAAARAHKKKGSKATSADAELQVSASCLRPRN